MTRQTTVTCDQCDDEMPSDLPPLNHWSMTVSRRTDVGLGWPTGEDLCGSCMVDRLREAADKIEITTGKRRLRVQMAPETIDRAAATLRHHATNYPDRPYLCEALEVAAQVCREVVRQWGPTDADSGSTPPPGEQT